jgi:glycosyltransferase involved in cell wall biosynthesis
LAGIEPDRLVYSPHGFAFQRLSAPHALRSIYFFIERLLSRKSSNFAGVSLDEIVLSRKMNPTSRSIFVPNTTDIPTRPIRHFAAEGKIELVCMGRLCPQKDPGFLVETLRRLPDDVCQRISVTWVGAGDPVITRALASLGVDVTGWVNHGEAERRLASCDLYFHTAAWEGFPMTVIEAAALGRPILLRSIRAFDGFRLPPDALANTAADAAGKLTAWVRTPAARSGTYAMVDVIRDICAPARQSEALRELYRVTS